MSQKLCRFEQLTWYNESRQHFTYKDNYSVIDLTGSPDLEKIAQAYDMPFIRVENMSQAEEAIDKFLNTEGSVLMECLVDPMDLV